MALPKVGKDFVANRSVALLGWAPWAGTAQTRPSSWRAGGGPVNGWASGRFAADVTARDHRRHIVLARDHGGPRQNPVEAGQKFPVFSGLYLFCEETVAERNISCPVISTCCPLARLCSSSPETTSAPNVKDF